MPGWRAPSTGSRSWTWPTWTCRCSTSRTTRGPACTCTRTPRLPRFSGDNREKNQRLVEALQRLAAEKGVTPAQLAVAWVLATGERIVPVMGARTRKQLEESLGALAIRLSSDDVAKIEAAVPATAVAGSRYQDQQMRMLDSER